MSIANSEQMRRLLFLKESIYSARDSYPSDEAWLQEIGKIEAMYRGVMPYEEIMQPFTQVSSLKLESGPKNKMMTADFFGQASDARAIKECLKASFGNLHNCNAQKTMQKGREHTQAFMEENKGLRRFKIWLTTSEAANAVFSANRNLFAYLDVYAYGNREDAGSIAAPTTLPMSNAQKEEVMETPEDILFEQEDELEDIDIKPLETIEKDVDMEFDVDIDF